ncbi:MAG TPA: glycoside hydrolase family 16 protein [Propionibacteriaceae bacterium]
MALACVASTLTSTVSATAAAPVYSQVYLSLVVRRTSVTATVKIAASYPSAVSLFGVCVRGPGGVNVDYPYDADVTITTEGTSWRGSKRFSPGSYTFFACLRDQNGWWAEAGRRTLTISHAPRSTVSPTPSAPPTSSPEPNPSALPVGDLPGWQQNFAEDFVTPADYGEVGRVYDSALRGYSGFSDTSKKGTYTPDRVLSVRDGLLDYYLHTATIDGVLRPRVAAPVLNNWHGQIYGRYSLRFRSDSIPGYKIAFLLWPSSDQWAEGEIDFPEGQLDGVIKGYSHCVGDPVRNCSSADTGETMQDWHIATTEWTPDGVTFFLDGVNFGTATGAGIPRTPMRWTLQAETEIGGPPPAPSAAGHLQVDWATSYAYSP